MVNKLPKLSKNPNCQNCHKILLIYAAITCLNQLRGNCDRAECCSSILDFEPPIIYGGLTDIWCVEYDVSVGRGSVRLSSFGVLA